MLRNNLKMCNYFSIYAARMLVIVEFTENWKWIGCSQEKFRLSLITQSSISFHYWPAVLFPHFLQVHAPYLDNYVAKSYFSKHDNLIDSKFEDFIAHDILSSGCISLQGNVEFPPKLTFLHRKLIGEGSHRRLSSSLRLKMSSESFSRSSKSFEVIIVERLPSGVFADPFELQHLVQRGGNFLSDSINF